MMRTAGAGFFDEQGRTLLLRGVNLGGSSKVPRIPDGATHNADGFYDHRAVSFVGRPFPIEEADEHFARLARWGFTVIRLVTTWEAIEHAGPGRYDDEYLDYFREVVRRAAAHRLSVLVDPHQDVWSRFSGGDGAPGWTFETVGLDLESFDETGAAITHQVHGDPLPRMIWPTNYGKLANLTMWTLFFGGNDFAPDARIHNLHLQDYLQGHYIRAMEELAGRLKGLSNVLGFGTLNEPGTGLIGMRDLAREAAGPLRLGPSPTALQAFALGDGLPQELDVYGVRLFNLTRVGSTLVNPVGRRAWAEGQDCVWRAHGVWDVSAEGEPVLLRPDHFRRVGKRDVDFTRDYYVPFARRFAAAIRRPLSRATIFLELPPGVSPTPRRFGIDNAAYAPHWYDGPTLFLKAYRPWLGQDARTGKAVFGRTRAEESAEAAVGDLVAEGRALGLPTVIGETGVPFDMHRKRALRSGRFSRVARALDATMRAMEANRASVTLWNYTPDNTNVRGDHWNGEDFSIYSPDQRRRVTNSRPGSAADNPPADIHDGGRALSAAVRPYPRAVPGELLSLSFDMRRRVFRCEFRLDENVHAPALMFVPDVQYPEGCTVDAPHGEWTLEGTTLTYEPCRDVTVHTVRIAPR